MADLLSQTSLAWTLGGEMSGRKATVTKRERLINQATKSINMEKDR
jgi:hypothetical protein